MRLIHKLTTAVRGGTREAMERVVDANSLRILDQEIHDCEGAIRQARQEGCRVAAERIRLQREAGTLERTTAEKEQQAVAALENHQEALAREVAQWIADNEPIVADLRDKQRQLEDQETRLKASLRSAIGQVERYRRELRMAQAIASTQSATERIVDMADLLPGRLDAMRSSLQRIKARHQTNCTYMPLYCEEHPGHMTWPGSHPWFDGLKARPKVEVQRFKLNV